MSTALDVVRGIYAAFQRGDMATILDLLADDVAWESWADNSAQKAGVPWLKGGTGKPAAIEFFGWVARMQIHELQLIDMLANERQVAVEVLIDATPPDGERYRDEELHLWSVNEAGQVTRRRHYTDTAKHLRAARLAAA